MSATFPASSDSGAGQPGQSLVFPLTQVGVSWSAVLAGAAGAAAMSLILLILGVGLGLTSISPWAREGPSPVTLGISAILWLTFTQLAASGLGGYLAGRLRTRWSGIHTNEVFFRDTAHGFLAWAVASLLTASLLSSVIGSIISGGVQAGAAAAGGVANTAVAAATAGAATSKESKPDSSGPSQYLMDSLFRTDRQGGGDASASEPSKEAPAEVARIFMNSIRSGELPQQDVQYVGQLVAQRTGLSQQDAEKRVHDVYAQAQTKLRDAETAVREAADKARKASAAAALWMVVALLAGAFLASFAATWGGKRRDA